LDGAGTLPDLTLPATEGVLRYALGSKLMGALTGGEVADSEAGSLILEARFSLESSLVPGFRELADTDCDWKPGRACMYQSGVAEIPETDRFWNGRVTSLRVEVRS